MKLPGFIAITRPLNSVVSGLASLLGYLVATGTITPYSLILVPITALITAGGNVINDYFDAEIDAINRPERPIPSGTVKKSTARSFAFTLFLAGILLSFFTSPLCIAIVVVNTLLLGAYAARFKSLPVVGNVAVSYLAASVFLFGGALLGPEGLVLNLPLAAIAFLATLARELLKDAEDVEGDKAGGAKTLPMQAGIPATARYALACCVLAAASSILPVFTWGLWYLLGIAIVDGLILAAALRPLSCSTPTCVRESRATDMLKWGFFASLAVFALSAFFL